MNKNYFIPDISTWLQSQLPHTLILVNKVDEFINKCYFIPDVLYTSCVAALLSLYFFYYSAHASWLGSKKDET